ncbi:acyltransferase family protein [Cryobacterium sp. AP23]
MGAHSNKLQSQLPQLTGLRGLAAAIVFVSHAAIVGFLPPVFGHGFGQVGVMIFFVLSGFLMAHLYIRREPSAENLAAYARARIGRVVPLYLVLVIISVVISNFVWDDFRYALPLSDPALIMRSLLFIEAPWELWTIPVEVQFYLVFVLTWVLFRKLGAWSVVLIAVAVSIPAVIYLGLLDTKPSILPTYGFAFFIGALTAVHLPRIKRALTGRVPAVGGIVFLALLFVNTPGFREQLGLSISPGAGYMSTWLDPITWLIVYGLFLSCLLVLPSLRFLDSKPFTVLGDISYGLYLLHFPILELAAHFLGVNVLSFLAATLASAGLAWLSYRFFEVPTMRLIRGHSKRLSPAASLTA